MKEVSKMAKIRKVVNENICLCSLILVVSSYFVFQTIAWHYHWECAELVTLIFFFFIGGCAIAALSEAIFRRKYNAVRGRDRGQCRSAPKILHKFRMQGRTGNSHLR
jgi:hypothetical protein